MGKVRVKTFDEQGIENKDKQKKRQEAKKMAKAPGLKGGEKVVSVGPSAEELEKIESKTTQETQSSTAKTTESKSKKAKFAKKKAKSKRYLENAGIIQKDTLYPLEKAIDLLKKLKSSKFDETVELHINTKEKGVNGQILLPHGTGKEIRVKIADDALISQIEKGKIEFDVLVAAPQMMPKLAKVARILGPKGLMPNPKAGTISDKPEKLIEELSRGKINFKTESEVSVIHMAVGKLSFGEKELKENIKTVLETIGQTKISNVTLKSTMSPAIKVSL